MTDRTRKPVAPSEPRVSISVVARRAGVSIATVSRVLNTPTKVAEGTAQKVHDAIRELDYRPNTFAKGLVTGRSRVIGIALPDLHGEFYSELMRTMDERAHEHGYQLLVRSRAHEDLAGRIPERLDLIDGLGLMMTEPDDVLIGEIERLGRPVVLFGVHLPSNPLDTVFVDQSAGTREATEHLLSGTDPKHCYHVGGPMGNFDAEARATTFASVFEDRGYALGRTQMGFGEYSVEWGWAWATRMLRAGRLAGSAVLAGNDEIAVGILDAARDAGLSVPGDVRLVGFDDSRLCRMMRPQLSSVLVPMREVGCAVIDALVARLENPELDPVHLRLSTSLVERESSRRAGPGESRA